MNYIIFFIVGLFIIAIITTGLIVLVIKINDNKDNYEELEFGDTKEFIIDENDKLEEKV